jgi:hypothetical protein
MKTNKTKINTTQHSKLKWWYIPGSREGQAVPVSTFFELHNVENTKISILK